MSKTKCILILSNMCSGSSACQNVLTKFPHVNHIAKTRHIEHETYYWLKAASILGLSQIKKVDRDLPYKSDKARRELMKLLSDNLVNYSVPDNDQELVFGGWRLLCERFGPVFLEKTPNYLLQWSVLELILESIRRLDDIDFLIIGLVRNPMDTLYSEFTRWKSLPQHLEKEWFVAYRNLIRIKDILGEQVVMIRYEDMVSSFEYMKPVFNFIDVDSEEADKGYLHTKSVQKWRKDKFWGFAR